VLFREWRYVTFGGRIHLILCGPACIGPAGMGQMYYRSLATMSVLFDKAAYGPIQRIPYKLNF